MKKVSDIVATITSVASGNWGTAGTWDSGVPVDGDAVVIAEGHEVIFNVDQSGFTNGLATLTINGVLHFKNDAVTCLKMNGNIIGTGILIVGYIFNWTSMINSSFMKLPGYNNIYVTCYNSSIAGVWVPSSSRVGVLCETIGDFYTEVYSLEDVESTPKSFMRFISDEDGYEGYYFHTETGDAPITFYDIQTIQRPAEGSESRCNILFNSTGTINIPTIRMYGWYSEREYTQLSADAASGQNQIILEEDLGLQAGDIISIGCGSENGNMTDTTRGAYTVNSYDSATKTVTLTDNLQKNRLIGDYVCIGSRPIKITRTSGPNALITTKIDNIIIKGLYINFYFISNSSSDITNMSENILADHCTSAGKALLYNVKNSIISNSSRITGGTSDLCYGVNNMLVNDIGINGADLTPGNKNIVMNCVQQNTIAISTCKEARNSIFKNSGSLNPNYPSTYINCEFSGIGNPTWGNINQILESIFIDCVFKDNITGYFGYILPVLYNCIFEGNDINLDLKESWNNNSKIESFDHNQIEGNYKAWCKGGTIETDFHEDTVLPGQLIFNCESEDYPVFRDYPILLAGYKTNRWQALANKSFTGGEVKIELIDPTSDPLIDSEATPLASYSLPDQADTNLPLKLGYKSDKAMQAILRISATNSEGTVEVDTSLIENRVQHG